MPDAPLKLQVKAILIAKLDCRSVRAIPASAEHETAR